MKSIFFSLATLALSAFAAPAIAEGSLAATAAGVVAAEADFAIEKRAQTAEDLINAIVKTTDNINTIGVSINVTLSKVKTGAITKQVGALQVTVNLQKVLGEIGTLLSKVLFAARIAVPKELLEPVVKAVERLVLATVIIFGAVLETLGLSGVPSAIVSLTFNLVASLFTGLIGVFGRDIAPGLQLIVQSLLAENFPAQLAALLAPSLKFLAGIIGQYIGN
ncbi:hypothetical protein ISF_00604 [Cordyceps fumosorosea ARSEF 2679]|uniref:Cell wall galactomannoprotein n=1 Tax=Cordyceps fumosorosea (strain ARSEF 2679) TaxID=1081104 RepID=A0A168EE30_CORFA|nr:hypothetical protein ISF_00604 [Cordyceps fumosorosea ARSEF 2679]OAA73703.1 hypothetical protein ISF_00604 [Cordyceps fumosorosea ARSEF 2679]